MRTRAAVAGVAAVAALVAGCGGGAAGHPAPTARPTASPTAPTAGEQPGTLDTYATRDAAAYRAALDAYVWGAPLVTMSRTRDRLRCAAGGANTLINLTRLATPADRTVVGPNNDTLYSTSWLDLRHGPVILGVPAIGDRYYSFQFLDAYTNTFDDTGSRTTGSGPGRFAVVTAGWRGTLPRGVTTIVSPTPDVWLLGRTLVDGPKDLPNVIGIQQRYTLTGADGRPADHTPLPAATCRHLQDPQDLAGAGAAFLDELGTDMAADPPPPDDRAIVSELAAGGIGAGRKPSTSADAATSDGLARGVAAGGALVEADAAAADREAATGGWTANLDLGTYGRRYVTRAVVAHSGLGANVAAESVYYRAATDAARRPLTGRTAYRIHFAPGELPPVGTHGFWSLTMYAPDHFLVANPIDRYSIGDRTPGVVRNSDGSLDLYLGATAPRGHESNWLPAPAGPFSVTLRLYVPAKAVLDRTWTPPPITP